MNGSHALQEINQISVLSDGPIDTYILSLDIGVRSLSEESRYKLRRGTLRSEVERSKSRIYQSIRIVLATERKQFRKDSGGFKREDERSSETSPSTAFTAVASPAGNSYAKRKPEK